MNNISHHWQKKNEANKHSQTAMTCQGQNRFFAEPFLVKKARGSRAAPLSLTTVSEIPHAVRSAWGELKNSPADCFSRGDCPAREGVPLPCGNVGVLNPHAEVRIDLQCRFSNSGASRKFAPVRTPSGANIYTLRNNPKNNQAPALKASAHLSLLYQLVC